MTRYKYPETALDNKLNFNKSTDFIHKRCQPRIFCLQKLRSLNVSAAVLHTFYQSCFESGVKEAKELDRLGSSVSAHNPSGGNNFSDRQSTSKQLNSKASFLGQKKWHKNKKQHFSAHKPDRRCFTRSRPKRIQP